MTKELRVVQWFAPQRGRRQLDDQAEHRRHFLHTDWDRVSHAVLERRKECRGVLLILQSGFTVVLRRRRRRTYLQVPARVDEHV